MCCARLCHAICLLLLATNAAALVQYFENVQMPRQNVVFIQFVFAVTQIEKSPIYISSTEAFVVFVEFVSVVVGRAANRPDLYTHFCWPMRVYACMVV